MLEVIMLSPFLSIPLKYLEGKQDHTVKSSPNSKYNYDQKDSLTLPSLPFSDISTPSILWVTATLVWTSSMTFISMWHQQAFPHSAVRKSLMSSSTPMWRNWTWTNSEKSEEKVWLFSHIDKTEFLDVCLVKIASNLKTPGNWFWLHRVHCCVAFQHILPSMILSS